jgi:hypothetical protein
VLLISVNACFRTLPQVAASAAVAVLTTAWMLYGVWLTLGREDGHQQGQIKTQAHVPWGSLAMATSVAMALAYLTGSRHDYPAYLRQWHVILDGSNPWLGTDNAYGMVHNLLAWSVQIHQLLPKLLFAALLVTTGAISAYAPLGVDDKTCDEQRYCLFLVFILSPFSLITVSIYANNDILPAAGMVVAIIGVAAFTNAWIRFASGGILAIGCMTKFYPIIIVLPLSFRGRKVDWTFLGGFAVTMAFLAAIAYGVWGKSIHSPLLYAALRRSRHLSIFNFLRNVIGIDLDRFSLVLMLAAFVTVLLFLVRKHAGPVIGSLLVFAATLSFYKLGQQQFFLFFFLVTPFAIRYLVSATTVFTPQVMVAFLTWIGFLNWYQLEYSLTCSMLKGPAHQFRYWGGLFYFLFSALLAWMLFRAITAPETRRAESLDTP